MQWAEGRVGTSTGLREHPTLLHQVSPETCPGWTGQQEPIAGRFSRSHREDLATPYRIVSYRIGLSVPPLFTLWEPQGQKNMAISFQ